MLIDTDMNSDFEASYKQSTTACDYITNGAFSQWLYNQVAEAAIMR